jgi:hypothetical protein
MIDRLVNLTILHKKEIIMAILNSPGVEVTISDESQYLPAAANSIPFVLLATAENKVNPSGTGIAAGTTAANAGKLFRVTSQRDLVNLYGTPFFYTSTDGTPLQGYELNEYGLLAAYSALGLSNTVYCMRADIDLADLVGQAGRPAGAPSNGSLWLNSATSTWGIFEFNSVTGQFNVQTPIVITDDSLVSNGSPVNSLGTVGSYAVIAIPTYASPTAADGKQYFYKAANNTWVSLGSTAWLNTVPTIQASNANPALVQGDSFVIGLSGSLITATVTVPNAPNNTVAGVAAAINALGWGHLTAQVVAGRLAIYSSQTADSNANPRFVRIASGTGTVLSSLGIATGDYNQPSLFYGKSSQQPLWQSSQSNPRPSGSVWIKVGIAGNGLSPVINRYDGVQQVWTPQTVTLATSDWEVNSLLDSSGGLNIPAGTLYAQYDYNTQYNQGPVYYWQKTSSGATVVTGTVANPVFNNGPYSILVRVSQPGSNQLSDTYTVNLNNGSSVADFVTAWGNAGIPFTTASVNTQGFVVLTHDLGGIITVTPITGGNLMQEAGFIVGNTNVKARLITRTVSAAQTTTSGIGIDFAATITIFPGDYFINPVVFSNAGSGYVVGDTITIAGTSLNGVSPTNDLVIKVTSVGGAGEVTGVTYVSGTPADQVATLLSPWQEPSVDILAQATAPTAIPANGTNWFYSVVDQVDIMVNYNGAWRGYKNQNYDSNGFPTPTGVNATNPTGPIVSASEPEVQVDGTALVYGDLWIDTSDLDNYPVINRWQSVNGTDKWVRVDNTNQTDPDGVLFADARWATNSTTNVITDPVPTIESMLTSNFTDLDRPDPSLYPVGMLLFNTRRSGYNVKEFRKNYFNNDNFPDQVLPTEKDAWVSVSGLQSTGAPFMGRKAQRAMVVKALRAAIDTNTAIRDEDNFFNLIAAPNYPELQPNMITLNSDRGETGFIVGDTPLRLADNATDIQAWATNAAGVTSTGEDGLVTRSSYLGLFYPSGITNDLSGNQVVVPASHMMLRTLLRNDAIAYPWFAPAGTRRGIIDNATSIGYLDARTGEFQTTRTRVGIRDVCYTNQINPLVFFTGNGLLNYGNKSSVDSQSALDRINVARLVAYIRRQLTIVARPFVFEQNDQITRQQITSVIQTLFVDLVAKRGIYDYIVVCDESNNTPARIDRNELYVDVAIEPVKAAEFIYIPVRVLNTGELSELSSSSNVNFRNV